MLAEFLDSLDSAMLFFVIMGFGAAAGFFCERAGIVNIGIDGQMIFGAFLFSIIGMEMNENGFDEGMWFLLPLLAAVILSVFLSLLFGFLVIKVQADHVVIGTALNLIMAGVATFLTFPLGSEISGGSEKLSAFFRSILVLGTNELGSNYLLFGETIIITIIAIAILVLVSLYLWKSKFGLRFKAIGDNPNAADAQGVNVNKYKWIVVIISGAFAAFAGSIFIYERGTADFDGNVSGLGFLALAIVIAGFWRLPFISIAAVGFSIITTIFDDYVSNSQNYLDKISSAAPFILSLVTLVAFSWKGIAPKALGKHFNKSSR